MPRLTPLGTERVGKTAEGRPVIRNDDGSFSTERSITGPWGPRGEWVNIPSMFGGKEVSEERAVEIMRRNGWKDPETGRQVEFYPDVQTAEAAAQARSNGLGKSEMNNDYRIAMMGLGLPQNRQYTPRDMAVGNDQLPQMQLNARLARLMSQGGAGPGGMGPGLGGFGPGMNPEMGGGRMAPPRPPMPPMQPPPMPQQPQQPQQPSMGAHGMLAGGQGQAMAGEGQGLGGGMDYDKIAMMLMGAGSAMGQAAAPSPYKTGLGTAMGAGIGGAMSGMMGWRGMQEDKKHQALLDELLRRSA